MDLTLSGLDGSTLIGFLAALGVAEAASISSGKRGSIRLGWTLRGTNPVIEGVDSIDALAALILEDAKGPAIDDVLAFRYLKREKAGLKPVGSLTPQTAILRSAVRRLLRDGRWQSANTLSCLMSEEASEETDLDVATKEELRSAGIDVDPDIPLNVVALQTPLDFTSRNTQFLDQIKRIRDLLTEDIVRAELVDGTGAASTRIMRWDALTDMPAALFGGDGPPTHPAAEWLAFRGASFFPLTGHSGGIQMPGFSGRRKAGKLTWVLWDGRLDRATVRSVLARDWANTDAGKREALGVRAAFAVSLRKDATGYDGAVSPSGPVETIRYGDRQGEDSAPRSFATRAASA